MAGMAKDRLFNPPCLLDVLFIYHSLKMRLCAGSIGRKLARTSLQ